MVVRLRLRQAFGRLIRSEYDRGCFVILDPRLASRFTTAFPSGVAVERVGLVVRWQDDCSRSHRAVADSLIDAFAADAAHIAAQIGRPALEELLAAHRLWSDWLREGRVRKIAFVAEKTGTPRTTDAGLAASRRS